MRSFFETGNAQFFEDVGFEGGNEVRDFVFEEEESDCLPIIVLDNNQDQDHISDAIQEKYHNHKTLLRISLLKL